MRRILATLAVVGALLFSAGSAWADYDDGMAAAQRGDFATALQEWRPLAEQGHAGAQNSLGFMYDNGYGVPENDAEAVKWWREGARQGHAGAQSNLGFMNEKGRGVRVNPAARKVRAYMWYSLAKVQGQKNAAASLDILKEQMSPAQIAKGKALATRIWKKINN